MLSFPKTIQRDILILIDSPCKPHYCVGEFLTLQLAVRGKGVFSDSLVVKAVI